MQVRGVLFLLVCSIASLAFNPHCVDFDTSLPSHLRSGGSKEKLLRVLDSVSFREKHFVDGTASEMAGCEPVVDARYSFGSRCRFLYLVVPVGKQVLSNFRRLRAILRDRSHVIAACMFSPLLLDVLSRTDVHLRS